MTSDEIAVVTAALAAPFDPSEVKFKPQTVSGNRALALPYVDARVIQDRLDDVLGVMGWQDHYECLPDGSVVCRLKVRIGGEWLTKEDVGGQSEQPDEGDRRKAAFSDALKRASVKFGIGRYLYRLKPQWCDYDPQKRQFLRQPTLAAAGAAPAAGPPAKQGQRPPSRQQGGTRAPASATLDLLDLVRLAEAHGCTEDSILRRLGLRQLKDITIEQYQWIVGGFRDLDARRQGRQGQQAGAKQ